MNKLIAGMALGFLAGMKCQEASKTVCMKRIKKQAMKKLGLW